MTAPTHATFGGLCYFIVAACLWWTVSSAVSAVAVLGALLPDIDIPTSAVGRPLFPLAGAINRQVDHRTLTHSLLGMGVVGLVAAPLFLEQQWRARGSSSCGWSCCRSPWPPSP